MSEKSARYVRSFFSRIWLLAVLAAVSAGVAYIAYDSSFEPVYEAKMKMMVDISEDYLKNINVYDTIRSSQAAVGDVAQIASSEEVLSVVEKECGVSLQELSQALTIDAIPNTRIIEIGIRTDSPDLALRLTQSLNNNLFAKLQTLGNGVTYKVLNNPYVNSKPINSSGYLLYTMLAFFGGLLLGGLINMTLGESGFSREGLIVINGLFKNENIFPVPVSKK